MRRHRIRGAIPQIAVLLVLSCAPSTAPVPPRAVVLAIGDGMGLAQIALARRMLLEPGERWSFEELPVAGIVSTWSASNATTDSGAAATAMATGVKTTNQHLGTAVDGRPLRTLGEAAIDAGWQVGYVTMVAVTHATPAAFYAHVEDRYDEVETIAEQLLEHPADVVLGGGLAAFLPAERDGLRRDGRNLLEEAETMGWTVWRQRRDLEGPLPDRLLGLFADDELAFRLDDERLAEEQRAPSLERLTEVALDRLSRSGEPFFLVVEGGRIDQACHRFDAATAAHEVSEFDRAIRRVLDYRRRHSDVLVVVTADHGTGGLALNDYVDWKVLRRQRASVAWMADRIRQGGAGVEMVREMTGIEGLQESDLDGVREDPDIYEAYRRFGRLLGEHNGVTWIPRISLDTKGHTGEDVPIYAAGPGAERFAGVIDNTDIGRALFALLGGSARSGTAGSAP